MSLPLQSWFLKLPVKESTETKIGKGNFFELQVLGVGQRPLSRSTPQVRRPSEFIYLCSR